MREFNIGDTVLYSVHGVCRIERCEERVFGGVKQDYYVLTPVFAPESTIFVPTRNEDLIGKIRKILSAEQIRELIRSMPDEQNEWIEDEHVRQDRYKKALQLGEREELIRMVKALYRHQREQQEKGRRLHITDERFMRDAEKLLDEEFAYVLNIRPEQVLPFIAEQIQVEEKA